MAQVVLDYFDGSERKAETDLGWNRKAIALGKKEKETGITCADNYQARGRKKTEILEPKIEKVLVFLVKN